MIAPNKTVGYWIEGELNFHLTNRTQSCPATPMGREVCLLSDFDLGVKDVDSANRTYRNYFVGKVSRKPQLISAIKRHECY